jgi:hypothetical protein
VFFYACSPKSEYQQVLEREIESGVRNDSLFLGIHFGMTSKEFFAHCWELNKQQTIYQGSGNLAVLYKMNDELPYPADMEFYPQFHQDSIWYMPVVYKYQGWAPPPSPLMADSLQVEVLALYEKWYGDDFIKISHPEYGNAFVRIDGNRQISIFKLDDISVKVIFKDLLSGATEDSIVNK